MLGQSSCSELFHIHVQYIMSIIYKVYSFKINNNISCKTIKKYGSIWTEKINSQTDYNNYYSNVM